MKRKGCGEKVFVAMSGGVDSTVAAALLKRDGYDVSGVTMTLYLPGIYPKEIFANRLKEARQMARALKIPHYTLDLGKDFREWVVDDFVDEYLNARTPNPCVRCNRFIKFGRLLDYALKSGAAYLATGHYARLVINRRQGQVELRKARDRAKDQSYFLYSIKPSALPRLIFPLGNRLKSDVRKMAKRFGLQRAAQREESQDICFIPLAGYKEFIKRMGPSGKMKSGLFKLLDGEVVGEHQGIARYTIGQRDKLGLALGYPVYVYRIDKKANTVYVGPREYLAAAGLIAHQCNFLRNPSPTRSFEADIRIRYNAPAVRGRIKPVTRQSWQVDFIKPQFAVTPGQSVVFYRGDTLLGGGLIKKSVPVGKKRRALFPTRDRS